MKNSEVKNKWLQDVSEWKKKLYPGVEYQELFDYMSENYNLTLLKGEMDEIINIVKRIPTS